MAKETSISAIIPAQPGWATVWFWTNTAFDVATPEDVEMGEEEIIAWVITVTIKGEGEDTEPQPFQGIIPVCAFGDADGTEPIKTPSGKIKIGFEAGVLTEAQVKASWLNEERKKSLKGAG